MELTLRSDLDVLLGRWQYQPAQPADLLPCYQHLANLALASGCRFWLQDLRRRISPDHATKRWLVDEYYPDMARRFGKRLFVAYLFSPDMHRQIVEAPDYAPAEDYLNKTYLLDFLATKGRLFSGCNYGKYEKTPPLNFKRGSKTADSCISTSFLSALSSAYLSSTSTTVPTGTVCWVSKWGAHWLLL